MLSSAHLSTPMETDLIELAERQGHGVKVRLLWRPGTTLILPARWLRSVPLRTRSTWTPPP